MNDSISILEQLVTAIEQAGVNVAPTYQEYMPLAFAIANSCGEEGRTRFHRICRISEKYHHDEADKLYGHALTKGTGRNSLGTVFHLAEVAGVKMDPKLANLQNLQSLHTHTRARVSYNAHPDASDGTPPDAVFTDPASPLSDGVSKTILPARLPSFPDYRWPAFLQGIIDCGNSPAQRDILLLGAATVLGSTLNKLVSFVYGRKHKYPCLQVFVTAPPASGKGALTWVRRLAEPIHNALLDTYREKIKTYRMEKTKWDTLGKEKANTPEPEQPQLKMLLIAGDNTGTGIQENLMDSGGVGLICETEADTVSTAIGGDHGHWSDLLRKCFDHDRLAYNRRTNHEYRECNVTFLCVLLSGTPAQIKPLIPSAENGLFSRQLFYYMPAIEEWEDQFNEADTDYDSRFLEWGAQWKEVLDAITASVSNINMKLTHEQKEIFNFHFARVFGRASAIHGNQMKSAVTRIAINIFRIISIIALLRSLESLLPGGERSGEPQENIVRTLLDDFAVIDDEDTVSISHGLEPVRYHNDGLVMGQLCDRFHQLLLILGVDVCRGLVEDDYGRVLHDRPRDGDALTLAAGERRAALPYHGVKAVGQRHDEVIAARLLCCGHHFLHGSVGLAEADVVGNGVGEQVRPLEHK